MMGQAEAQMNLYHTVQLEQLVPENHPFRRIRPLIDAQRIRGYDWSAGASGFRGQRPTERAAGAVVSGDGRGLLAGSPLRPEAGDGTEVQHGVPMVCGTGFGFGGLGRHDVFQGSHAAL